MTKKELLARCNCEEDEQVMLAQVLDRLAQCQKRGMPVATQFFSPREQQLVQTLLKAHGGAEFMFWGGWEQCERASCVLIPDGYEPQQILDDPEGVLCGIQADFPKWADLSHRDILGSLMGIGIRREKLGDIILPAPNCAQVVALRETLPILLTQWEGAGRYRAEVREIALSALQPAETAKEERRDSVASLRLDSVLASGFSLSRTKAAQEIARGNASINHKQCLKPERQVETGDVLTCKGLGKCVLKEILGQSKKGRTMVLIERYV